jgi:hypothetical protein
MVRLLPSGGYELPYIRPIDFAYVPQRLSPGLLILPPETMRRGVAGRAEPAQIDLSVRSTLTGRPDVVAVQLTGFGYVITYAATATLAVRVDLEGLVRHAGSSGRMDR